MPEGRRVRRLPLGIGRGLRIAIDLRHFSKLYVGLYEVELNSHLRRLCRRGYRSFDVGGQNGYDALVLAKLSRAEVISFECEDRFCEVMRESFDANPDLRPLLGIRRAFVTAASDPVCDRLSLDDAAYGEHGFVPDFIKMDIEGGELDALHGARRLLEDRRPNIVVEVQSPQLEADCAALLAEHGYTPRVVQARRWLKDNRPSGQSHWLVAEGEPPRSEERRTPAIATAA